jgi:hypothetical protein
MWQYGMRIPNPMVYHVKGPISTYLILTNPIPQYFVLLPVIGIMSHGFYVPLPPGTWVNDYSITHSGNNRHETPTLITTEGQFAKGSFWILWWHNLPNKYWTYEYKAIQVGNFKIEEVPNINVKLNCRAKPLTFKPRGLTSVGITKGNILTSVLNKVERLAKEKPRLFWSALGLALIILFTAFLIGFIIGHRLSKERFERCAKFRKR